MPNREISKEFKIKVLIADDQLAVRNALKIQLNLEPDMEVVGAAINGLEAVEMTQRLHPDVVIMDIEMPLMNGIEATERLSFNDRNIPVIVLTVHDEAHFRSLAMEAGAAAFIAKHKVENLLKAIRQVSTRY